MRFHPASCLMNLVTKLRRVSNEEEGVEVDLFHFNGISRNLHGFWWVIISEAFFRKIKKSIVNGKCFIRNLGFFFSPLYNI